MEIVICFVVRVMVCFRVGSWREMFMFAAVSVMVCYRQGERWRYVEVC